MPLQGERLQFGSNLKDENDEDVSSVKDFSWVQITRMLKLLKSSSCSSTQSHLLNMILLTYYINGISIAPMCFLLEEPPCI